MKAFWPIAFLQILALCTLAADAFIVFSQCTLPCMHATVRAPTRLLVSKSTNETAAPSQTTATTVQSDRSSSSSSWSLEQDWALIDAVPRYTVGNSDQCRRTFWTQLLLHTQELSQINLGQEQELMARYEILRKDEKAKGLPPAGKSPSVLHEWSLDEASGRMRGYLEGRSIWFETQMVGQFNANNVPNTRKKGDEETMSEVLPGGFVEAVGGRVFELGEPKQVIAPTTGAILNTPPSSDNTNLLKIISRMMISSTVLASATLATVIGMNVGLVGPQQLTPQQASLPPPKVEIVQLQKKRGDVVEINKAEQSIGERRARLEVKVLRDARVLKTLKEKLQQDETQLKALKTQQASASAVSDVAEQNSIQQQISKIDARTERQRRVIASISRRLPLERSELRQLRQAESSLQKR